jgi:hypothetical protein
MCVLENFITKDDWSITSAAELEGKLDEYSEVRGVQDLQDILASYRPGGGEYLYDKKQLQNSILYLIGSLRD